MAQAGLAEFLIWLTLACVPVAIASDSPACKLPEADARDGATAPTLDGSMGRLRDSCFRLTPRRETQERPRVCLTPRTRIFTVFGGHVAPAELRHGQRVHVWLKGCQPPAAESASEAVVIEVASLKPGEDFP